ncbi:hypothetical protein HYC85_012262 [Camellia sinensis]|uniref:Uncharacterized protein n=1 Tax=Camellia sinensis TaxID=4442 RepID=A0A7J7HC25_CAMSI|nr:hypothetical protein HYC85_012262 [Camellia sinensis]
MGISWLRRSLSYKMLTWYCRSVSSSSLLLLKQYLFHGDIICIAEIAIGIGNSLHQRTNLIAELKP